ncbi:MAG: uroporphyrinogen-III synthase [Flavobacteriales bacterium AspAUS03]
MIKLLVTKVLPDEVLDLFPKLYYHVESRNFIIIEFLSFSKKPALNKRIIFSSQNAVEGFIHNFDATDLKDKKLYVVGDHTAVALQALGGKVSVQRNNAKELAEILEDPNDDEPYDWFCSTISLDDLPKVFRRKGFVLNSYKIYRTKLMPQTLSSSYDGILFFSPSAVEAFFQTNMLGSQTKLFTIGKTTAKALATHTNQSAAFPKVPKVKNLLMLVKDDFDAEK